MKVKNENNFHYEVNYLQLLLVFSSQSREITGKIISLLQILH